MKLFAEFVSCVLAAGGLSLLSLYLMFSVIQVPEMAEDEDDLDYIITEDGEKIVYNEDDQE